MPLSFSEINTLNLAMRILEIRARFCRYGIMTVEEYMNARVGDFEEPLVYDTNTLDEDGMYTIYAGYRGSSLAKFFEDIYVRFYPGDTRNEDFIEVAVPVVDDCECPTCKTGKCEECDHIKYYQLYLIGRDGLISEDIETVDECDSCDDCDCAIPCHFNDNEVQECECYADGVCNCAYNSCDGCSAECIEDENE